MTAAAVKTVVELESPCASRARYHTSENPFTFSYAQVPARQFLAERKIGRAHV